MRIFRNLLYIDSFVTILIYVYKVLRYIRLFLESFAKYARYGEESLT
ncbi:hypothetical protein J5U21_01963 [Saccharolobus shibatae]|uniref:Uncharacterized protein n=1 Tax=Saccharolobus shibatae TaxID=2286 RepID=A0A8F5GXC6_9CREN|nr:hypothetical protein J5U21_01963 [Saccharolobus shibatae]